MTFCVSSLRVLTEMVAHCSGKEAKDCPILNALTRELTIENRQIAAAHPAEAVQWKSNPVQSYNGDIGDKGHPRRRRPREPTICSRLTLCTGGSHDGIFPRTAHTFSWTVPPLGFDETRARMRADGCQTPSVIESP